MIVRNEEDVLRGSIERIYDYVDEIIFVDMQSTDKTAEIAKSFPKVKYFEYPYQEPVNMGEARTFSLQQATGDWFLQIDADEYYPKESMEKMLEAIKNEDIYSIRVKYYNVAWRWGYVEPIEHYPDRLYKREVVSHYHGVLPLDMTVVKEQYRSVPHKGKGMEGVLEYDNVDDHSFEHPKQPIRKDIVFYHLARARGFNFEYTKKKRYELNCGASEEQAEKNARWNQWVTGMYTIEPHDFPKYIPKRIIPNPKVSVIIPCYNKSKDIAECIQSVQNQSYKPFEVIVVDDGSTDNSRAEIDKFDVIKIYQTNQGVAAARNNGLNRATGDYFILIDGDDKLHPDYIKRTLEEMTGDIQVVYTDFQGLGEWDWVHHYSGNMEDMKVNQCVPSTMALCDMRILDPYGNFKEMLFEDYEWWLNVYFNRKANFKHIPEPLCYYRRTTGTRIDYLNTRKEEGYRLIKKQYGKFGVDPH